MKLFGKRKIDARTSVHKTGTDAPDARVLVLGTGCPRCAAMGAAVEAALCALGLDLAVGHVTDYEKIAAYGVLSLPGLVIDGKVVSSGKVLTKEEAMPLLARLRDADCKESCDLV